MNNETLDRLNTFIADYKKEFAEKDALIAEYKETLRVERIDHTCERTAVNRKYHEAIRERDSLIADLHARLLKTNPLIDEEYVGCCKVVDVAANLQKELNESKKIMSEYRITVDELYDRIHEFEACAELDTKKIRELSGTIEESHTKIWELEKSLPENFWDVVGKKDSTIRYLREQIKTQATSIEGLIKTNYEKDVALTGYQMQSDDMQKDIDELKNKHMEELKELYGLDKEERDRLEYTISARDLTIKSLTTICQSSGTERNKLTAIIESLEAELSARKQDSEVLMKEQNKEFDELRERFNIEGNKLKKLRKYLDELYELNGTSLAWNAAIKEMITIIDEWVDGPTKIIDEPSDITVTLTYLELP